MSQYKTSQLGSGILWLIGPTAVILTLTMAVFSHRANSELQSRERLEGQLPIMKKSVMLSAPSEVTSTPADSLHIAPADAEGQAPSH